MDIVKLWIKAMLFWNVSSTIVIEVDAIINMFRNNYGQNKCLGT